MKNSRWLCLLLSGILCLAVPGSSMAADQFGDGSDFQAGYSSLQPEDPSDITDTGSDDPAPIPETAVDDDSLQAETAADSTYSFQPGTGITEAENTEAESTGSGDADHTDTPGVYALNTDSTDTPGTDSTDTGVTDTDDTDAFTAADAAQAADGESAEDPLFSSSDAVSAAEDAMSGKCGENVTWELTEIDEKIGFISDEDGDTWEEAALRLTISGSGPMADYNFTDNSSPWHNSYYNSRITEVVFAPGSRITHIGEWAFVHCFPLKSVVIPDSVTTIGCGAFNQCTTDYPGGYLKSAGLKSVTIPRSVTFIGEEAFSENDHLTTVNWNGKLLELAAICEREENTPVPRGLVKAFWGGPWLGANISDREMVPGKEITWDASDFPYVGTTFLDVDKIESSKDGWYLVQVNANGKTYTDVTLMTEGENPEDFREEHLTHAQCYRNPAGVMVHDSYWFPVQIPAGSEGKKLGIHIVTMDGETSSAMTVSYTIQPWKQGLVVYSVPWGDGVTGELSILEPEGITGYNPNHDETWDGYWTAFSMALTIKGTGAMHDSAYDMSKQGDDPSQEHTPWQRFGDQIRKVTVENGITHIGDFAFAWLNALRDVSIAPSVTSIGRFAFAWCQIGEGQGENFKATDGLKSIAIPSSVKSIGESAFQGQTLENLTYGNGTILDLARILPENLGNLYFERLRRILGRCPLGEKYCNPQKGAIALDGTLGNGLTWKALILDAEGIQAYNPNHGENWDGYFTWYPLELVISGKGAMTDYYWDYSIPRDDPRIIDVPWHNIRNNVTKLTLEKGLTHIGAYAFKSFTELKEVSIPEGATSIGAFAFKDCQAGEKGADGNYIPKSSILTLTLPMSLKSIGEEAFRGNPLMQTVNYPGTLAELAAICWPERTDNVSPGTRLSWCMPPASPWAQTAFPAADQGGKLLSSCSVTLSFTSKTYTGKALKPKVTVKDGSQTLSASAYTVAYANNKNAGTATVTLTATQGSGYAGIKTAEFTINKAKSLKLSKTSYTKTAATKAQSFSLGATAQGKLTYTSSDKSGITVSSKGKATIKKNYVGTVTITVKAAATKNYKKETATVTVKVKPAAVTLNTLTSTAAKKLNVKWSKNAKADGYQIQCATNGKFTAGKKSKKVTGAKNVSATVTGLSSGKV